MKKIIVLFLLIFSINVFGQNLSTGKSPCDSVIAAFKQQLHQKHDSLVKAKHALTISQAKKDLWGDVPPVSYLIGLLFAFIGIFINTYVLTAKSVKKNESTPAKFSWSYWWANNKDRILRWIGLLFVIAVSMRFSNEILNVKFTVFIAFLLGLGLDRLVEIVRNLKNKIPIKTDSPN